MEEIEKKNKWDKYYDILEMYTILQSRMTNFINNKKLENFNHNLYYIKRLDDELIEYLENLYLSIRNKEVEFIRDTTESMKTKSTVFYHVLIAFIRKYDKSPFYMTILEDCAVKLATRISTVVYITGTINLIQDSFNIFDIE